MMPLQFALALTALALPMAAATDPPPVKEGLWEIHTQSTDSPSGRKSEGSYQLCRDHAYDQEVRAHAKEMKGCTTVSENFQDGKYSSEMHCVIGTRTVESKGVTTFQGDTAFRSETRATYSPALGGVTESNLVMEQKYVGSCPAEAQPGDRINSDGSIIHLRQK
jgi:hypothetical protein